MTRLVSMVVSVLMLALRTVAALAAAASATGITTIDIAHVSSTSTTTTRTGQQLKLLSIVGVNNNQTSRPYVTLIVRLNMMALDFDYGKLGAIKLCIYNGYYVDCHYPAKTRIIYEQIFTQEYLSDQFFQVIAFRQPEAVDGSDGNTTAEKAVHVIDGEGGFLLLDDVTVYWNVTPSLGNVSWEFYNYKNNGNDSSECAADTCDRPMPFGTENDLRTFVISQLDSRTYKNNATIIGGILQLGHVAPIPYHEPLLKEIIFSTTVHHWYYVGHSRDSPNPAICESVSHITCCRWDGSHVLKCTLPPVIDIGIVLITATENSSGYSQPLHDLLGRTRGLAVLVVSNELASVLNGTQYEPYLQIMSRPDEGHSVVTVDMHKYNFDLVRQRTEVISTDTTTTTATIISRAQFSFQYGINVATLSNACLINRTTIALFDDASTGHNNKDASGISESLLPRELQDYLQQSHSGFMTQHPGTTGWTFINRQGDDNVSRQSMRWMSGTTLIASPPYSPSIFHLAQVLMTLTMSANTTINDDLYIAAVDRAHRLLLPTVSVDDYDWTLRFVELVVQYRLRQRRQQRTRTSIVDGDDAGGLSGSSDGDQISVYMKEHMERFFDNIRSYLVNDITSSSAFSDTGDKGSGNGDHVSDDKEENGKATMLCFDELVVLGALELNLPFIAGIVDANAFRDYVYETMGVDHAAIEPGPNTALKITVLMRATNRWILNLKELLSLLETMGIADVPWLQSHVLELEDMSFVEQVAVMAETDILISPHGAALTNLIFMRPHSAVIELMTSPWYEIGYQPTALTFDIHYQTVPVTNLDQSFNCAFPEECLAMPLYVQRRTLACYGMRQCSSTVSLGTVEVALWAAVQSVRIKKRRLDKLRREQCAPYGRKTGNGTGRDGLASPCVFQKAYVSKLT
jgi:Glycosyltransferase 61